MSDQPSLNREQRRALAKSQKQPGSPRRKTKALIQDPMAWVLEGMEPVSKNAGGNYNLVWKVRVHGSMRSVVLGKGTKSDLDILVSGWNIVSALCNTFGEEHPCVIESRRALIDLCERSNKLQRVVAKGWEINAINELIELHDQWLNRITVRDMELALAWCKRMENQAHVLNGKNIPK